MSKGAIVQNLVARSPIVAAIAVCTLCAPAALLGSCGGTTGREDLPSSPSGDDAMSIDAAIDATFEAGLDATDELSSDGGDDSTLDASVDTGIDVTIQYASPDRFPDVNQMVAMATTTCKSGFDAGSSSACSPMGTGQAGLITGMAATCTPTEQVIYEYAGQDCLSCLMGNFCLDDMQGDTNLECSDVASLTGTPNSLGVGCPGDYLCLNELACILSSNPNCASSGVGDCYCGTSGANCSTSGAANGVCLVQEEEGLDYVDPISTPASLVLSNFSTQPGQTPMYPGQIPNAILNCAHAASCTSCYNPGGK